MVVVHHLNDSSEFMRATAASALWNAAASTTFSRVRKVLHIEHK
jgi:hypothetical protein